MPTKVASRCSGRRRQAMPRFRCRFAGWSAVSVIRSRKRIGCSTSLLLSDPNATRSPASYSWRLGGRSRRFPCSDDACADLRMKGFSAFRTATKPSPSRVSTLRPRLVAARLMATRRPCWPTVPNPGTGAMRAPVARSGARHVHRGDHRLHLPRRPRAMAHCTSQDDETQLHLHPPSRRWRRCTYS